MERLQNTLRRRLHQPYPGLKGHPEVTHKTHLFRICLFSTRTLLFHPNSVYIFTNVVKMSIGYIYALFDMIRALGALRLRATLPQVSSASADPERMCIAALFPAEDEAPGQLKR